MASYMRANSDLIQRYSGSALATTITTATITTATITTAIITAITISAVTIAWPALASEAQLLEEVTVTAEHRQSNLQDTQISISAFTADDIRQLGISSGLDIAGYTPNINVQPYAGGRSGISYNIRGVYNAETLISFDPAVSVYIDGILIAKNTGALLDALELERIEVLRGPQGTLYGRNTMGGAINYITRKPGNELSGSFKTSLGNYNQRDYRGMLNLPLLDASSALGELNLRTSLAFINRDGTQDNEFSGAEQDQLGDKNRDVGTLHLQWLPNDALSVLYSYDNTRINEIPESTWLSTVRPDGPNNTLATYIADENSRPDSIWINEPQITKTDVDGHTLNVSWQLSDDMALQSLSGYRTMENFGRSDFDGSPNSILATRDLQQNSSLSQEFRLVGSLLEQRLNYSTGLFYMDESGEIFNELTLNGTPRVNLAEFSSQAWAAYGQLEYALTRKLNLTVGLRYTEEERALEKAAVNGVNFVEPVFPDDVGATYAGIFYPEAQADYHNLSPMIALGYNINDDVMTYFKISSGYQSGGFNLRDGNPIDFVTGFDEETLIAYEWSVKSQFLQRFQLNTALWLNEYDDKRVNNFNPATVSQTVRNAGVVKIWGLELEALAQLTEQLQLGVNYGYVDPQYVEYDYVEADGSITDRADITNFPFTPKNTVSAFLGYEQPLDIGVLRARLDWNYRNKITFQLPQPERNSSANAELFNARIALEDIKGPDNTRVHIAAWIKNLTDEGYWNFGSNVYDTLGFSVNTYGEPRTYGVDFEVAF